MAKVSDESYQVAADKFIFTVKKGFLYAENDVWVKVENGHIRFGVTDYLQRRGGDIIYIQLPKAGDKVERLGEIAQLETIKTVLMVASPFEGTVSETNPLLNDKPEVINEDPYGKGWLVVISPSNLEGDMGRLLTAERYFELMKMKIQDELKKSRKEGS